MNHRSTPGCSSILSTAAHAEADGQRHCSTPAAGHREPLEGLPRNKAASAHAVIYWTNPGPDPAGSVSPEPSLHCSPFSRVQMTISSAGISQSFRGDPSIMPLMALQADRRGCLSQMLCWTLIQVTLTCREQGSCCGLCFQ